MVYVPGDLDELDAESDESDSDGAGGDDATDGPADVDGEHDGDLEALQEEVDTLAETVNFLAQRLLSTDDDDESDATGDDNLVDEHGEAPELRGFY